LHTIEFQGFVVIVEEFSQVDTRLVCVAGVTRGREGGRARAGSEGDGVGEREKGLPSFPFFASFCFPTPSPFTPAMQAKTRQVSEKVTDSTCL